MTTPNQYGLPEDFFGPTNESVIKLIPDETDKTKFSVEIYPAPETDRATLAKAIADAFVEAGTVIDPNYANKLADYAIEQSKEWEMEGEPEDVLYDTAYTLLTALLLKFYVDEHQCLPGTFVNLTENATLDDLEEYLQWVNRYQYHLEAADTMVALDERQQFALKPVTKTSDDLGEYLSKIIKVIDGLGVKAKTLGPEILAKLRKGDSSFPAQLEFEF